MKIFKKVQTAGAVGVMLVAAGVAMSTAQAESLLAPLVIEGTGGWHTYFAFKMGRTATDSKGNSEIHYTYLRKNVGTAAGLGVKALLEHDQPCEIEDNKGVGSPGDIIYQRADGVKEYYTGLPATDASSPAGYTAGPFVGMIVIDTQDTQDGNMSGFGYLVNATGPTILDYKLLNNHHSKDSGDFSIGFISKTAVDFMWLSTNPNGPAKAPVTGWTLAVTGPDMSKHGTVGGLEYSSWYDATVRVSQQARGSNDSPSAIVAGAYDNDETVISGNRPFTITCMGSFSHSAFLTPLQNAGSQWGGWTRKSIQAVPVTDGTYEPRKTSGAFVYRSDSDALNGLSAYTTMQVETGGHLAAGHNHVNRPY